MIRGEFANGVQQLLKGFHGTRAMFSGDRFYVYVDDTSKLPPGGYERLYPILGVEIKNPVLTERNIKNISTRCKNIFTEKRGGVKCML